MSYQPRLSSHKHQLEALDRIRSRPPGEDVFALMAEMGTGKSKIILDEWGERAAAGELDNLLILAPAGSYCNWFLDRGPDDLSEATKHIDPNLRERMEIAHWNSAGGIRYRENLARFLSLTKRPRMFVVNIEALSSVARARNACEQFIASGRTLMCVDESTKMKNHSARRTKVTIQLGSRAVARRIASGLITPRSPLDLYSQFEFLDWRILGCRNFYVFRAIYAVVQKIELGGRMVDIVVGFRNLEQLQARIKPWSYRVLKSECLDLEPKVYETRDVELTDEQQKAYRELKQFATTKLGESYVTATVVITLILRLHQLLCGHIVDEQGVLHELPERRTQALLDILEEHGGKAIIWCSYDHDVRRLVERLQREYEDPCIATAFWGGNRGSRAEEEGRFKNDPACRFMVATPGAGGLGNNWTVADLVIYYSNTYDLELRAQSEDRAHRYGQQRSVTYIDLVARGTVDEKILHVLRNKINLASAITGDNYREWVV